MSCGGSLLYVSRFSFFFHIVCVSVNFQMVLIISINSGEFIRDDAKESYSVWGDCIVRKVVARKKIVETLSLRLQRCWNDYCLCGMYQYIGWEE